MRGKIGSRGGSCGVKIYRALPQISDVLLDWLINFLEEHILQIRAHLQSHLEPLGALRKRKPGSSSTMFKRHSKEQYQACIARFIFAIPKVRFCVHSHFHLYPAAYQSRLDCSHALLCRSPFGGYKAG